MFLEFLISYAMRHNDAHVCVCVCVRGRGRGGRAITNDILNFRIVIDFESSYVHVFIFIKSSMEKDHLYGVC